MNKRIRWLLILFTSITVGCKGYSLDSVPYVMTGDFVMEEGASDYSICGIDCFLLNKSDKEIQKIDFVFYLFDLDGEPAYECRNKIAVSTEINVSAGESTSFCMSLDQFMNSIPSDLLIVDYLYIAKIEYEDGSNWEDPYGMIAFK